MYFFPLRPIAPARTFAHGDNFALAVARRYEASTSVQYTWRCISSYDFVAYSTVLYGSAHETELNARQLTCPRVSFRLVSIAGGMRKSPNVLIVAAVIIVIATGNPPPLPPPPPSHYSSPLSIPLPHHARYPPSLFIHAATERKNLLFSCGFVALD